MVIIISNSLKEVTYIQDGRNMIKLIIQLVHIVKKTKNKIYFEAKIDAVPEIVE